MNRINFLKSLGLGTCGLILPANGLISTKSIKIYDNYIRSLIHYDFHEIMDSIQEGDEVQLVRESTYIYDSFAIQVNRGAERLGYIAPYENIVLANMMDTGVDLRTYIGQKDMKRPAQEWLAVEVFAELVMPTQKLVDSLLADNRADDAPDIYRWGEI